MRRLRASPPSRRVNDAALSALAAGLVLGLCLDLRRRCGACGRRLLWRRSARVVATCWPCMVGEALDP